MKVFLSWSGQKSKGAAEALHDWLRLVIQEVEPFMSESDIAAGARWLNEIDQQLEGTNFAIVCVTRENQSAAWLNFEAGAVAKLINTSRVVPLAIDLSVADVKPPLGHFQAKDISKAGILAVLESLNEVAKRPLPNLGAAFEKWWPDLEPKLRAATAAAESAGPVRGERELLEEVLASVRSLAERSASEAIAWDRLAEAEARASDLNHQLREASQLAEEARAAAIAAERAIAERRSRDRTKPDRALKAVLSVAPPRSYGRVLDDPIAPRILVVSPDPLTTAWVEKLTKVAVPFGFGVAFDVAPEEGQAAPDAEAPSEP